jgi:hypothetical protein
MTINAEDILASSRFGDGRPVPGDDYDGSSAGAMPKSNAPRQRELA